MPSGAQVLICGDTVVDDQSAQHRNNQITKFNSMAMNSLCIFLGVNSLICLFLHFTNGEKDRTCTATRARLTPLQRYRIQTARFYGAAEGRW